MKQLRVITGVVGIALLILPARSFSLPATGAIVITEVQTASALSASEEFIELYNDGAAAVDVSKYTLEYYSATSNFLAPSRTIPLHGTLQPGKYYLVASTGYLADAAYDAFSPGLAATGGHVQLVSTMPGSADTVHDLVGWGSATHPEGTPAAAPEAGSSIERNKGQDGKYIDTDDNEADFSVAATPTPTADNAPPLTTEIENPEPSDDNLSDDEEVVTTPQLQPLQITELLPNPASPASDSTDEYVELYNPNAEPVDLSGYKLQTGNSYSYSYTFTAGTIAAQSYEVFMVTETGVLLANSSGKARLIDPNGAIVSETDTYDEADDGSAWALLSAGWLWTTSPTPGLANVLTLPAVQSAVTTQTAKPKAKTATKKTTVKPKTSTKKAAAPKKSSASTSTADKDSADSVAAATADPPSIHPGVLAGVSALAVGYAAYEYRHDVANRIHQLRRYRAARRAARKTA